jgi:hypothetical protein
MGKIKGQDGEALKERGMKRAADNPARSPYLEVMRLAALEAPDRHTGITIEDAYDVLLADPQRWGVWTWEEMNALLGNAAGSVFKLKADGWKPTGRTRKARLNPSNHARKHDVWRIPRPVRVKMRIR